MTVDWLDRNAPKLARISFFLYVFFLFFGTGLPFQDHPTELLETPVSNPINQYVFSALYLASLLALLPVRTRTLQLARQEKFLTLFLLWSLASVFWSDFVFISFKRWIQLLGMVVVFSAALVHRDPGTGILDDLKAVLFLYIPLSLAAVLLVSGATEPDFNAWRGFTSQKNMLGQSSLAGLIVLTLSLREDVSWNRVATCLLWCMTLVLLLGSRSTTSLLAGGILLFAAVVLHAERTLLRPFAGGMISFLTVLAFFLSPVLILFLEPTVLDSIFMEFGKDMTFTNRVDIWANVFDDAKRHLLVGCGFDGYWVPGTTEMDLMFKNLQFIINQGHLGYLDILNETGVVGLGIVASMVIHYLKNLVIGENEEPWKWFVFAALIVNFQESTIFRLHSVNGALFVFSYLALFAGAVQRLSPPGES